MAAATPLVGNQPHKRWFRAHPVSSEVMKFRVVSGILSFPTISHHRLIASSLFSKKKKITRPKKGGTKICNSQLLQMEVLSDEEEEKGKRERLSLSPIPPTCNYNFF